MANRLRVAAFALLCAGWVMGSPYAAGITPQGGGKGGGESRASQIIGSPVRTPDGESLGKISDLLMDPEEPGHVAFAVIARGFLGTGGPLTAVPFGALTWDEQDHLYLLDMSKDLPNRAPGFDGEHWPDLSNRAWGEEIYRYYGRPPYWTEK